MKYLISKKCYQNINTFYHNVAKKYKHTYSKEMMHKNIDEAIDVMYQIENGLQRRTPTISRWQGYFMANTKKWYYAYTVSDDIITIVDACHAQNMHESKKAISQIIKEIINRYLRENLLLAN